MNDSTVTQPRVMFVYRPDPKSFTPLYFHTEVRPTDETREEDYWRAQGYRVEFEEIACL